VLRSVFKALGNAEAAAEAEQEFENAKRARLSRGTRAAAE
jgi:hypothetical protein